MATVDGAPSSVTLPRLTVGQRAVLKVHDWFSRLGDKVWQLELRRQLPHLRSDTVIGRGSAIYGGERITFGQGVRIGRDSRLQIVEHVEAEIEACIEIGAGTSFEDRVHVGAIGRVAIGEAVLVASDVLISDHLHGYTDVDRPVADQPLLGGGLSIGGGSHIGEHVTIVGSLSIGRQCVIGANSVVLADVPDYSVAVGAPARVVRRYDEVSGTWTRTP